MTLSQQAATGSADREAVAIALGWKLTHNHYWENPFTGEFQTWPPDYQRDLAATLAEIERRGWTYSLGSSVGYNCSVRTSDAWACAFEATGTTIANAACAALLKALENSDD